MKSYSLRVASLVLMAMVGIVSFAHDIEVKNDDGVTIYYNYIESKTALSVTFRGQFSSSYNEYNGNIVIPESVKYNSRTYKVKAIGDEAFYKNNGVTSVTIPSSVTSIGVQGFAYCKNLKSLTLPNSVTSIGDWAFSGSGLTEPLYNSTVFAYMPNSFEGSYTIPDGITTISVRAFYNCLELTSVDIPNSVTTIGDDAFAYCEVMTSIKIGRGLTTVGKHAFQQNGVKRIDIDCNEIGAWFSEAPDIEEVTIREHVQIIGDKAFYARKKLESVNIGNGVTTIGSSAFAKCTELTSIEFPEAITAINSGAFYGCTGLTSITIPENVTTMDAFQNCTGLTSVVIPNKVTTLYGTFSGCTNLTSVTLSDSLKEIGSSTFEGCVGLDSIRIPDKVNRIESNAFYNCTSLKFISLGRNSIYIDNDAFNGCSDLSVEFHCDRINTYCFYKSSIIKDVTISENVKNVMSRAFSKCKKLESVRICGESTTFEDNVFADCTNLTSVFVASREMGNSMFANCTGLTSVVLGDSVRSIGDNAFGNCTGLTSVAFGNSVNSIGNSAFLGCSGLTSVVLGDSLKAIGNYAFHKCSGLTSVVLGDSVKTIGNVAFADCSSIKYIRLPNSIEKISNSAFANCEELTAVELPDNLTTIEGGAFMGCKGLTSINIPSRVKTIDNYAFKGCTGLTFVEIPKNVENISGSPFEECTSLTSMSIQCKEIGYWLQGIHTLNNLTIGDSVETIVDNALKDCTALSSVEFHCKNIDAWFKSFTTLTKLTIGDEVEAINDQAFNGCYNLSTVILGANNRKIDVGYMVFSGCRSLTSPVYNDHLFLLMPTNYKGEYAIPSSISSIAGYAFLDCVGLTSITMSDNVTYVGTGAFQGTGITTPVYNKSIFAYLPPTIKGAYTIPNGIMTIAGGAFASTELTGIEMPNSVTTIGEFAFSGSTLPAIDIPSSVTTIGKGAFYWTGLKTITIPSSVKVIEDRTFEDCENLTTIILPDGLTTVGENAFANCNILDSLTIGTGKPVIANTAFDGDYNLRFAEYHCDKIGRWLRSTPELNKIIIGDEVKSIESSAFYNCKGLERIIIGRKFPTIGINAFVGCSALNYIEFHCDTVSKAFNGLSVKDVKFCEGVDDIESKAFYSCSGLKSVTFDNCIPTIGANAFPRALKNIYFPACAYSYFESVFGTETYRTYYPQIKSFQVWMPYCATASYDVPECIEAYVINGFTEGKAVLKKVTSINEGQGVLLKFNTDALGMPHYPTFCTSAPMGYKNNLLKGVIETTEISSIDGEYTNFEFIEIDGNACFCPVNEEAIPAYKAYLQIPTVLLPDSLPSAFSTIDESETGIIEISSQNKSNEGWYTLSGSHIIKPTKTGLYVRHGKKVLIK